jgi:hypothetical protein
MNDNQPQLNNPGRPTRAATACPKPDTATPADGYQPIDTHNALSGRDLRYVLTTYITQGFSTVAQLVKKLAEDGYTVWGRASKVVSDALRWEIRNGRIRRLRRGVYTIDTIPKSTRHRIINRTRNLFHAPHVVAIRRDLTHTHGLKPTPSPDRNWREWRRDRESVSRRQGSDS